MANINDKLVEATRDLLKCNGNDLIGSADDLREVFKQFIQQALRKVSGPDQRTSNTLSMFKGLTMFKQDVLLQYEELLYIDTLAKIKGDKKEMKAYLMDVADFFKLELHYLSNVITYQIWN